MAPPHRVRRAKITPASGKSGAITIAAIRGPKSAIQLKRPQRLSEVATSAATAAAPLWRRMQRQAVATWKSIATVNGRMPTLARRMSVPCGGVWSSRTVRDRPTLQDSDLLVLEAGQVGFRVCARHNRAAFLSPGSRTSLRCSLL